MSSNFYQASAFMVGIDPHLYLAAGGPIPLRKKRHSHFVFAFIGWGSGLVGTVTADGHQVVQENSTVGMFESASSGSIPRAVVHLPLPILPPHPAEAANIVIITLLSSSKAKLAKASVHAAGAPLAYCLYSRYGLNVNCSDLPVWCGIVISSTTVVTQTELADVARAIVSAAWDYAVGRLVKKLHLLSGVNRGRSLLARLLARFGKTLGKVSIAIRKPIAKLAEKAIQKAIKWVAPKIMTAIVNGEPGDLPVGAGLL